MTGIVSIQKERTALLVVDVQYDFLPGGALEVKQGDAILDGVAKWMTSDDFRLVVGTQDWHPEKHISFASEHANTQPFDSVDIHGHEETAWPDHCVQQTRGAELVDELPWHRAAAILRKGMDPQADSYSAFRNNWDATGKRPSTGLAGYLRERDIDTVVLCGLARDVCVFWSAQDAIEAGFRTICIWDLTRAVVPDKDDENREALRTMGVVVCESSDVENQPA